MVYESVTPFSSAMTLKTPVVLTETQTRTILNPRLRGGDNIICCVFLMWPNPAQQIGLSANLYGGGEFSVIPAQAGIQPGAFHAQL